LQNPLIIAVADVDEIVYARKAAYMDIRYLAATAKAKADTDVSKLTKQEIFLFLSNIHSML
jgi:hypothetical protein